MAKRLGNRGNESMKAALRLILRIPAWLLGSFMVMTSILDILGFIPYSDATPAWTERLLSNLPVMAAGLVLLAPMTPAVRGRRFAMLIGAYGVLVLFEAESAAHGIQAYLAGGKHWLIVPTSLVIFAIFLANTLVLWWMHHDAVSKDGSPGVQAPLTPE